MQHALVENNFNKLSSIYYRRYVVRIYIVDNSIFVIIKHFPRYENNCNIKNAKCFSYLDKFEFYVHRLKRSRTEQCLYKFV